MKISLSSLRGCIILVGGVTYRVTSVRTPDPAAIGTFQVKYCGEIECLAGESQLVWVLRDNRKLWLVLTHTWLQHGHRGVIHARAEVQRYGRGAGSNRWLRVGLDFPRIPSAALAERVRVPWRQRRPRTDVRPAIQAEGPTTPLPSEELTFDDREAQS